MGSGLVGMCFGSIDDPARAGFHRELFARYASLMNDKEALARSALWPKMVDPGVGQVDLDPQEFLDELRRYIDAADPDAKVDYSMQEELERRVFYLTREWIGRSPHPTDAVLLSLPAYLMVSHGCRFLYNLLHGHMVAAALIYSARNADEGFVLLLYNAMQECFVRGLAANPGDQGLNGNRELVQFMIGCVGVELHRRMMLAVDPEDGGWGFFDWILLYREGAPASEGPAETQNDDVLLMRYFNEGVVRLKPNPASD
ncbi:MAG: hypothetical protein EA423_12300 [Phycisphaerales bacterium]|nr:MAG: hypothetical protein EA423_12300 [Phycisphaerales bacterium]